MEKNTITITDEAYDQVLLFLQDNDLDITATGLRLGVKGSGCSGLSYDLYFDEELPGEEDSISENKDLTIYVDSFSLPYINGAEIGWSEDALGGGFKINNPNAIQSCGCSKSFSVDDAPSGSGCGGCSGA